jgi:asparagine N-glycosylation enzyme membrane subunit Stt3
LGSFYYKKILGVFMTEFVIVLIIIAILVALGFGLIGMVKGGKEGSDKMFKSLVTRVSLSVLLFILVLFSGYMGWIEPNIIMVDAPIAQK